jgi:protein-tyrosine phosphatase
MPGTARLVMLEGCRNFRDIGGYATADGRRVRTERIYRSGVLAYLTEADKTTLSKIGIRTVCDLRDAPERDREPSCWRPESVRWITVESHHKQPDVGVYQTSDPEEIRTMVRAYYRDLPRMLEPTIADVFPVLAANAEPLLIHCSMGKDRTGILVSLLLSILGVSRQDVLADYALSDHAFVPEMEGTGAHPVWQGVTLNSRVMKGFPREVIRPLMGSSPEYLGAALSAIEEQFGSLEEFLTRRANVSSVMVSRIREQMIVD